LILSQTKSEFSIPKTKARTQFYRTEFAVSRTIWWHGSFRVIRILIVDDNPAVRRYLRAILEQQESWQVCGEARTGAEALQQVLEAPPDLIVLDYQMPDLNGVDIAKQISELLPQIPILMVTLHLSKQLADAAREAGIRGACAKQDIGSVVEAVDVLLHNQTYFRISSARGA
jgi:two-component system invasion response regulator UvrY